MVLNWPAEVEEKKDFANSCKVLVLSKHFSPFFPLKILDTSFIEMKIKTLVLLSHFL